MGLRVYLILGSRQVVKMDIEGGEYKVLTSMLADGSINRIDELFVECHYSHPGAWRDRLPFTWREPA
jgi:hypothetical protein